MRPITVNVGPLTAAATFITAAAGTVGSLGNPSAPTGGSVSSAWAGTASIAGAVMTVNTTASGVMSGGQLISGLSVAPNTKVIGPGPTANTWIVNPPQTVANRAMRGNSVVTFDTPRGITVNNTDAAGANTFTIVGTDGAGNQITETLVSTGATQFTSQNFATVTQIYCSAPTTSATVFIGTNGTATTPWVMFDPYASGGYISKQTVVNGVANYTVQVSYDDPNAPGGVAPGSMGWLNDTDATFVGATTSLTGSWPYTPLWARVLLNSGAGSVRATFIQPGNLGR